MAEQSKLLSPDPEVLARAKVLEARARRTVEELAPDSPRGAFQTYAREFSGYREVPPTDKLRRKEWQAGARTGKFSHRKFTGEASMTVHLVIDGSDSMKFASNGLGKFDYAQELTACLAYLTLLQDDAVQLSLFDEKVRESIEATSGPEKFSTLTQKMAAWEASGLTRVGASVAELAEKLQPGGLVVLLSDFFEETDTWMEAVERLRFHGNEVVLMQIMDPEEMDFPFNDLVEFVAMEEGDTIKVQGTDVRGAYLEELKKFFEKIRSVAANSGSHYILGDSSKPLSEFLQSYLLFRNQSRRF